MNLKQAINEDKLEEFIKERASDPPADMTRLNNALNLMIKNQPEVREALPEGSCGDCSDTQTHQHKKTGV